MISLAIASALIWSSQSVSYYKLADVIKGADAVEIKLFDLRTTASCPQCRGDIDDSYDISMFHRCRFTCGVERSRLVKLLQGAIPSDRPCDAYKIGKITLYKGAGRQTLKIDHTGSCISFGALDYKTPIDASRYLADIGPLDF